MILRNRIKLKRVKSPKKAWFAEQIQRCHIIIFVQDIRNTLANPSLSLRFQKM